MELNSYGWDARNRKQLATKGQKTAIFRDFLIFSKTVRVAQKKFSTFILQHVRVLYVQWHPKLSDWDARNIAKTSPKTVKTAIF